MTVKINPLNVLSASVFIAMLGLGLLDPILPIYAQDLGASLAQIGLLTSAFSVSRFIFLIPVGRYSDRTSKKRVIMAGLFIFSIVSIFYTFSWDFTSLISIRLVHGIGSAMFLPVILAYGADITPEGREGEYMGIISFAMMLGIGFGPFLGGALTDLFSKNAVFYAMTVLTGGSLLLTVFLLPDIKVKSSTDAVSPSYTKILSNKTILSVVFFNFISYLGEAGVFGFLSVYLSIPKSAGGPGLSFSLIGVIFSVGVIVSSLLQGEYGKLADRYDKHMLILVSGLIGACGVFLFPFMNNLAGLIVAQILFLGGITLSLPAIRALVAIEGKQLGTGTVMSVVQLSETAGHIIGSLLAGIVAGVIGLSNLFYLEGFIMILAVLVYYLAQR